MLMSGVAPTLAAHNAYISACASRARSLARRAFAEMSRFVEIRRDLSLKYSIWKASQATRELHTHMLPIYECNAFHMCFKHSEYFYSICGRHGRVMPVHVHSINVQCII